MNVAFDMLTLYLLFLAAGEHISLSLLLAGYGLPLLLAKVAFFIPGGVGVVEGGMAALYHVLGIPLATVLAVVLGYRLISFWLPSLAGFPIAAYLQRSQRKPLQPEVIDR
jgi:glycosyltransferase 2 family protein